MNTPEPVTKHMLVKVYTREGYYSAFEADYGVTITDDDVSAHHEAILSESALGDRDGSRLNDFAKGWLMGLIAVKGGKV